MQKIWIPILALLTNHIGILAQDQSLASQFAEYAYDLSIEEGRLSGQGAELLLYEITQTDFFLIGEDRGVAEIPQLTQVIYQRAYDMGLRFTHLALEISEYSAGELERLAIDADAAYLMDQYFAAHPSQIPYYELEEESYMLSQILSTADDYYRILWGLDFPHYTQLTGIWNQLETFAPENKVAKTVQKYTRATEKQDIAALSRGEWDELALLELTANDFEALQTAYDSIEVALSLISTLSETQSYYQALQAGENQRADALREAYMFQQFQSFYREALSVEAKPPRVIVKLSDEHLYKGFKPGTNIASVGKRIAEYAETNRRSTYHLRVMAGPDSRRLVRNETLAYDTVYVDTLQTIESRFFDEIATDSWKVVDLRSYRKQADLTTIPRDLKKFIEEYDALIILRGSKPASLRQ